MQSNKTVLTCGLVAITGALLGKHQRILSESRGDFYAGLEEVLASLTYKLGDKDLTTLSPEERKEIFAKMPSFEKRKLLVDIRQASLGNDPYFDFDFTYKSERKETKDKEITTTINCMFDEGFPFKPTCRFTPDILEGKTSIREIKEALNNLTPVNYSTVDEMIAGKKVDVVLPNSKMKISFTMLDAGGEAIIRKVTANTVTSHTPLLARNPIYYDEETGTPIRMLSNDLDKLTYLDIETLRAVIKAVEGRVDTEYKFTHPEADLKPDASKYVVIDVLSEIGFFFPSGALG